MTLEAAYPMMTLDSLGEVLNLSCWAQLWEAEARTPCVEPLKNAWYLGTSVVLLR